MRPIARPFNEFEKLVKKPFHCVLRAPNAWHLPRPLVQPTSAVSPSSLAQHRPRRGRRILLTNRTPVHPAVRPELAGKSMVSTYMTYVSSCRWRSVCEHTSLGRAGRYLPDAHGPAAIGLGRKIRRRHDFMEIATRPGDLLLPRRLKRRPGRCISTCRMSQSALITRPTQCGDWLHPEGFHQWVGHAAAEYATGVSAVAAEGLKQIDAYAC